MTRRATLLGGGALLLTGVSVAVAAAGNRSAPVESFAVATVHFEQNATDRDAEVVFEVKGGDDGLVKLTVVAPNGRTVIDFTAPDASTLGIRQFRFESPEPKDVERLAAAYPEGMYTFAGTTASGESLQGEAALTHELPAPASLLHPQAGTEGVEAQALVITWAPVESLAAYVLTIEQEDLGVSLTARLPGSVTRFAVPDGWLLAGTAYQLSLGTVTEVGNTSFIETWFTTADKE